MRKRLKHALDTGRGISLEDATRLWSLSNLIYIGPIGPSAKRLPEAAAYKQIADDTKIREEELFGLLGHESPTVAGYALELLIRRGSERVPEAVSALRGRAEEVSLGLGCVVCFQPLRTYAVNRIQEDTKR
jgi:hypothetical protein